MTVIGAVDIGGTKIATGLVDENGRVVARGETPTEARGSFEAAIQRTISLLSGELRETGAQLRGIGIGSTGPVDPVTGVIGNVNHFPHWEGSNPVTTLAAAFGVSVAMENDADAAALGEAMRGSASAKKRFVFVTVGTGIGVTLISDGRIYRGAGGFHPEIGHIIVEATGPQCSCGARGCWEVLASGPAISDWYMQNAPGARPGTTTADLCKQAVAGDAWSQKAIDRGGFYLGIGLVNLITTFVPDSLVLAGSVMKSANLFMDKIQATIRANCLLVPYDPAMITLSSLGPEIGVVGAAEVWRHRYPNA